MTLVLVILAIIWVAVLVPPAIRARAEARPADSISAFRRQLTVLHRARPGWRRTSSTEEWAPSSVPSAIAELHRRPVGGTVTNLRPRAMPNGLRMAAMSATRSRTLRRRRDVLVALLATVGLTFFLAVLGLAMMWWLQLLADVLLGGYVALLIRQRNVAAEQAMKVRFLVRPAMVEPALLRRSVN